MKHVTGCQTRVALGAFAVQLDSLEADIFLRQRSRQQGNGLDQKAIEPLAGVCLLYTSDAADEL